MKWGYILDRMDDLAISIPPYADPFKVIDSFDSPY
jgi:hypothetical protein